MGKKNKDDNPNNVPNKDILQRLNFMYQASVYLGTVFPVPTPPPATKRTKRNRKMNVHDLSKAYISSMKSVANKTMVKIDPAVKRTLCNGCNLVLIPGPTVSIRVKSSREHGQVMVYLCAACNSTRRIPAPPTLSASTESTGTSANDEMEVDALLRPSKAKARLPPLFARDVGHIVFRGNEQLARNSEFGDGIYIT
ncbi:RNAse P Rpr2/Rpp21/SNM1 subunit domain-containing protein [Mycena amicta]|nr:RNAse P Rpr2/Rpp21/SNM1 subunit domain-containing protein [Mycena amicta]